MHDYSSNMQNYLLCQFNGYTYLICAHGHSMCCYSYWVYCFQYLYLELIFVNTCVFHDIFFAVVSVWCIPYRLVIKQWVLPCKMLCMCVCMCSPEMQVKSRNNCFSKWENCYATQCQPLNMANWHATLPGVIVGFSIMEVLSCGSGSMAASQYRGYWNTTLPWVIKMWQSCHAALSWVNGAVAPPEL